MATDPGSSVDTPAHISTIGCGVGWSCAGMARAYPAVMIEGVNLDEASIAEAQQHIAEAGVGDRVSVAVCDAADLTHKGRHDLIAAYECIHDMPDPVAVLRTMRNMRNDHGAVVVMDERVADSFDPVNASEVERMLYGFSLLHCLPAGLADRPSVGTSTITRPSTLRDYARAAGFEDIEILPIENDFFNFYRLVD